MFNLIYIFFKSPLKIFTLGPQSCWASLPAFKIQTMTHLKPSSDHHLRERVDLFKSISSRLGKFLYYLENEQWLLPFNCPLFQIQFPIDSLFYFLSHLNIIFSFIIYSFFNNYISSNIFLFNTWLFLSPSHFFWSCFKSQIF